MDFGNQYLSYNEYLLLGGTMQKAPFNKFEYKSRKKIDELTFNRFTKIDSFPQELKLCVYDLIEIFLEDESPIFLSDGIGNYNPSKRSLNDIEKIKANIVNKYLSNTYIDGIRVIYRGVE